MHGVQTPSSYLNCRCSCKAAKQIGVFGAQCGQHTRCLNSWNAACMLPSRSLHGAPIRLAAEIPVHVEVMVNGDGQTSSPSASPSLTYQCPRSRHASMLDAQTIVVWGRNRSCSQGDRCLRDQPAEPCCEWMPSLSLATSESWA